ncbi:hypothetical protein IW136_003478 [Coemansia sp. RSA 678]|nr:hypothetical protein IW136_003478 [Coemansia sp. RSA 678]
MTGDISPERPTFLGLHSRDNASIVLHASSGIRQALGFAPSDLVNKYSPSLIADHHDPKDYSRMVNVDPNAQSNETEEAVDEEADAFVCYMNLNTASGTPVLARITSITCDTIVVVIGTAFPEVPFESRAAFKGHKLENRARQLEAERMRLEAEQVTSRRRRVQKQRSMYRSRSKQAKAVMLLEDADVSCIETEETGRRPNGPMVVFCTGSISQVVDADNSDIMNHPFLKLVAPEDVVHVSRFFDRMAASDDVVFETFSLLQRPHVIEGDIFVSDEENMRVVVEALGANVQDGIAILVRKIKVVRAPTRDTMGNYVRAAIDADIDMENLSLADLVSSDPETSEAPEQWSNMR